MKRPLRRYHVTLAQSSVYEVIVMAVNAQSAEAKAERLWKEDVDALTYKDGNLNYCEAELVDEEAQP